jgi:hypothetical protein
VRQQTHTRITAAERKEKKEGGEKKEEKRRKKRLVLVLVLAADVHEDPDDQRLNDDEADHFAEAEEPKEQANEAADQVAQGHERRGDEAEEKGKRVR